MGIENIIVKYGEKPDYIEQNELDFLSCKDLIEYVKENTTLSIGVIVDIASNDLESLKQDIGAGASVIFTAPFFDNNMFYDFIKKIRKENILVPVVACVDVRQDESKSVIQCLDLIKNGVEGVHLCTDNSSEKIHRIFEHML